MLVAPVVLQSGGVEAVLASEFAQDLELAVLRVAARQVLVQVQQQ